MKLRTMAGWVVLAGLSLTTGIPVRGQVLPTIRAFSSNGGDSGNLPVVALPDEVARNGTGAASASSATSSILEDFRLRQQVSASASNSSANAVAFFNLQGDELTFTETGGTRSVRINWEVLYAPLVTSTLPLPNYSGSQNILFRVDGSTSVWGGLRSGTFSFNDQFGSDGADVIPTSSTGSLDFDLFSGQSLTRTIGLSSSTAATGSATNLVSGSLTTNVRVWLEILTPDVELLSTTSLFPTYGATGSAVPEPASFALWAGLGLLGFAPGRRKGRAT